MADSGAITKKDWRRTRSLAAELAESASDVAIALNALLDSSGVEPPTPLAPGVIFVEPFRWSPLADADVPRLSSARAAVERWFDLGRRVLRANAPELEDDFFSFSPLLSDIVDRSRGSGGPSRREIDEIRRDIDKALQGQSEVLRLAGVTTPGPDGPLLLIPDTNALYANPALEEWEGTHPATLVLVPQVVRELDRHKTQHPNQDVRAKAVSLIRRIANLGERGDTFAGVPLAGSLRFRELAIDADPEQAPSWMRLTTEDDRFLASALELQAQSPGAAVTVVTLDRNVQNKARLARLEVDTPPTRALIETPAQQRAKALPDVTIGHPSAQLSLSPLSDDLPRRLLRLSPRYPIENKGQTSIRDVTSGIRTREGVDHAFDAYRAQLIAAGEVSWVDDVSIPVDLLEDVYESTGADVFQFWARFTDSNANRWEVVYDPATRTTAWNETD